MNRRAFLTALPALTLLSASAASAEEVEMSEQMTADQIVQSVHLSRSKLQRMPAELSRGRTTVPFEIEITESLIRYNFRDPAQTINLAFSEKGARLTEVSAGSNKEVPAARYSEAVRGTDLNYDDVSMRYLYWPDKTKIGTETIKTRRCFVVDLKNPQKLGDYYLVRIFVDRSSGALMRVQSYDWNGKLIKVCAVTSGQKVNGITILKTMEVTKFKPGSKDVESQTTMEIKKA